MKQKGKYVVGLLTVVLALLLLGGTAAYADITAASGIAMDYDTGEVLYAKDIDTMRVPASMTKIMTAYIIYEELEKGNLTKDTMIPVSARAAQISRDASYPTPVPLQAGASYSVDQYLKLIMVPSASASCIAVAEYISGSEEAFVQRMNETAKRLGMTAQYQNCHGARPHYITARSIAILIRDFIHRYPDILNYTSLREISFGGKTYPNTNKLLSTYYYEGADGFKTGTIAQAGYCLSATAQRDGHRVITVVMKSSSTQARHTDSIALLDAGFAAIAQRDAARQTTEVRLECGEEQLRHGAEFTASAAFSGVTASYYDTVVWTVNGEPVAQQDDCWITDGGAVQHQFYIEGFGQASATVGVEIRHAGETIAKAERVFAFTDENAPAFRDISHHWAEGDITALMGAHLVSGYEDGRFYPDRSITRAEFVSMLMRCLQKQGQLDGATAGEPSQAFQDCSQHWAAETIGQARSLHIIGGDEAGNFRPDSAITRQEVAAILQNAAAYVERQQTAPADEAAAQSGSLQQYSDAADIADWAAEAVAAMDAAGIMHGYPDGRFAPNGDTSRAECASVLQKALKAGLFA